MKHASTSAHNRSSKRYRVGSLPSVGGEAVLLAHDQLAAVDAQVCPGLTFGDLEGVEDLHLARVVTDQVQFASVGQREQAFSLCDQRPLLVAHAA